MTEKEVLQIVKRALREERKAIAAEVLEAMGKSEAQKKEPMTVKQAAEYTGPSVQTLYWKSSRKELPHYKTSENGKGRLMFDKKDLDAAMLATRIPSKAEVMEQAAQLAQI